MTAELKQLPAPLLVNSVEACQLLAISPATLRRYVAAGKVPAPLRVGGVVRFRRADLEAFVAQRAVNIDGRGAA